MYYLAVCDNDGRCFGYLRTDNTASKDPDSETINEIHIF